VIEACALGLPVVSTAVGGVPFLLTDQETGLLVPSNDVGAFTKAIKNLLESPVLVQRLSTNGRKLAAGFDWEQVRPVWNAIIQKHAL
jgi:glycosyltransferase involved in cell wall biosynthesis